jgi:hypothetical protein
MVEATFKPDNLIASNALPITVQTAVIASGSGELARGAVLSENGSGKYTKITSSNEGNAELILAEDVDATSADVVAKCYNNGEFFSFDGEKTIGGIQLYGSYTSLSGTALKALKNAGIHIVSGVEA